MPPKIKEILIFSIIIVLSAGLPFLILKQALFFLIFIWIAVCIASIMLLYRIYMFYHRDVVEEKEAIAEVNKVKTDFITLASHQLLTPLTIIKWQAGYLLSDKASLNEEQRKYLEEISLNNQQMIELVNALLDVSRIDIGTFAIDPEPADIVKISESALKTFITEIERKKISVIKEYGKDLPVINIDPKLTKVVFQNLLFNSLKYTSPDGFIKIAIARKGDEVLIEISDTGCGIPEKEHPGIFSKMFRGTNAKKIEAHGIGLGLYIVKAIVEKSGGKIWFESPLSTSDLKNKLKSGSHGKGTSMYLSFPLIGMKKRPGTKKLSGMKA